MAIFKVGETVRIESKEYCFTPCTAIVKEKKPRGMATVQIIEAPKQHWVCERHWMVYIKDLKKMDTGTDNK